VTVGIPPPSRNQRTPTASETPANTAASLLDAPSATASQNTTRSSRRPAVGRPGERITGRPVIAEPHPRGLPIATPPYRALQRPLESAQYLSGDYTQTLADQDVLASVGSTGDAYDNALAESFIDSFKTELINDRVWRTRPQLELAIVEYIRWFNDSRLHENLNDRTPREIEELRCEIQGNDRHIMKEKSY
jgi:putative transposase